MNENGFKKQYKTKSEPKRNFKVLEQGCHNFRFCKSSGCNFYGFLHLDCHEYSLNKSSAKYYRFLNR